MVPSNTDEFAARFPDEIRMLLAMLRMSNLGGLAVAECSDLNLRARLIDYFKRRLESDGIYVFSYEVGAKDTNLIRSLTELTDQARFKNLELTGKYKSIVIFVYGIEKFNNENRSQFVRLLNFLRDRLTMIAQPIVIWGNSAFVTELARNAPDFWSWKGHFFTFPSTPSPNGSDDQDGIAQVADSPIHRYLSRIIEDPDYAVWKDLYLPLKANRANEALNPFPPRHTLTKDELRQLAPLFPHAEAFEANQIVFKQGDRGDKSYVIVSGEVEVLIPDALGNEMVVSKLGRGDFFGEVALIKRVPRTATVRTAKPCKFVTLTHRSLNLINHRAPDVLEIITDVAQRRLELRSQDPKDGVSPLRRFAMEGSSLIRETPVDVRDLIAHDRRTVILGEAGGGKTTVLRRLMLDTAQHANH
ncbi:MAG: cyclic nucleotide-binding domain-containing protein, partial [Anaerolineae bacterium]|nr:cyclic nucleotide-binding domain-containing protein [Anaerolineae bacterium]